MPHPQSLVVVARQDAARACPDDAADFLERLVCIDMLECLPLAQSLKPARKLAPAGFAPGRNANRLDEFAIGKKGGLLVIALEAAGVVQIARVLGEVG